MEPITPDTGITIAIVKRAIDWQRITTTHQYHIPVQYMARIIHNQWVAFYFPRWHSHQAHSIQYVGTIASCTIMPRCTYIDEPHHPHAHRDYVVVTFDTIYRLAVPIYSNRWRRISVHHTTWGILVRAYDLGALRHVACHMRTLPDTVIEHDDSIVTLSPLHLAFSGVCQTSADSFTDMSASIQPHP